jgi:hypothetical protein
MHTQALERLSTEQYQLLSWMTGHSLIYKWPTQAYTSSLDSLTNKTLLVKLVHNGECEACYHLPWNFMSITTTYSLTAFQTNGAMSKII